MVRAEYLKYGDMIAIYESFDLNGENHCAQ